MNDVRITMPGDECSVMQSPRKVYLIFKRVKSPTEEWLPLIAKGPSTDFANEGQLTHRGDHYSACENSFLKSEKIIIIIDKDVTMGNWIRVWSILETKGQDISASSALIFSHYFYICFSGASQREVQYWIAGVSLSVAMQCLKANPPCDLLSLILDFNLRCSISWQYTCW